MTFLSFLVCALAGLGAGISTGFAGLSAAVIIAPMLIGLVGVNPYDAVGISLGSDVLASAASSYTYYRNKNIHVKNGLIMMICAVIFTLLGSLLGYHASNKYAKFMEYFPICITILLGLKFIIFPKAEDDIGLRFKSHTARAIASGIGGVIIGIICGTVGAGGGMMLLIILTGVLGYDLKTAVGTSVFIMAAVALTGATTHYIQSPDFFANNTYELLVCVVFTLIGALAASMVANRVSHKTLNIITGVMLICIGAFTFLGVILGWDVSV